MIESVKYFYNNYDFELLASWFHHASVVSVITNPFVFVPIVVIIGMIGYVKTSELGQRLVLYVPAVGYLFVTGVILKNDVISNLGPFIMAMIAFFMIIGWLVWTQLLKS